MKTKFVLTLAFTTVGVTAGAFYEIHHTAPDLRILTGRVSRGEVARTVVTTGVLQAPASVQVGTEVAGLVTELHADYDSIVHRGEVLARLDSSEFRAQVDQAKANLARARADEEQVRLTLNEANTQLARYAYLAASQINPTSDLEDARVAADQAEAQLKAAEADVGAAQSALREAEVNLAHTVIRSPLDGIVISRAVDVGQTVVPRLEAPTLFVICNDLSRMQAVATIDESDIASVRAGLHASIEVDAFKGHTFDGTVTQVRVQPVDDQGVVSYNAIVDVPNPRLWLRPGMTAIVTIGSVHRDNVLRVPVSALRFEPNAKVFAALNQKPLQSPAGPWAPAPGATSSKGAVWVLATHRLTPVAVTLGMSDGTNVEVLDGQLAEGTELATASVARRR